jgi:hypothetical protein
MATTPPGPLFDIPPLTMGLVLPPYQGVSPVEIAAMSPYVTTLVRIGQRFCGSTARVNIMQGLLAYRQALAGVGMTDGIQWLSGSFLEDIETLESRDPRDIDVVTFFRRPAHCRTDAEWRSFSQQNQGLFTPLQVRARFHCDAYVVDLNTDALNVVSQARYWFGLFSHRRGGLWKGILQVPLSISQDDLDASNIVQVGIQT